MPDGPTISNSSPLMALQAAGYIHILQQCYETVEVPEAVAHEFGPGLPAWAHIHSVKNKARLVHYAFSLAPAKQKRLHCRWNSRLRISSWMIRRPAASPGSSTCRLPERSEFCSEQRIRESSLRWVMSLMGLRLPVLRFRCPCPGGSAPSRRMKRSSIPKNPNCMKLEFTEFASR